MPFLTISSTCASISAIAVGEKRLILSLTGRFLFVSMMCETRSACGGFLVFSMNMSALSSKMVVSVFFWVALIKC